MKKFYINEECLKDYEKQTGLVSYKTLIDRYCSNKVLCNNVASDECFNENLYVELENLFSNLDETTQEEYNHDFCEYFEGLEIYQYYITDCSDYEAEALKKWNNELIVYSDSLDCYILCVTHYGTSWDYVSTNVEWSTEWSEC